MPTYLPDGDIVFTSTREPQYCMCNRHIMGNLFRAAADGTAIRQIGKRTLSLQHATTRYRALRPLESGSNEEAWAVGLACGRLSR